MLVYIKSLSKENVIKLRSDYHITIATFLKNIIDMSFDSDNQIYTLPLESKEAVLNFFLGLNINVYEVDEFPTLPAKKKELFYGWNDKNLELSFTYTPNGVLTVKKYMARFNDETCYWIIYDANKNVIENLTVDFSNLGYKIMNDCPLPNAKAKPLTALVKKTKDNVEIEMQYRKGIIEKLKSIKKAKFDGITKRWSFPGVEYNNVLSILSESNVNVTLLASNKEFTSKENTAKYIVEDKFQKTN